MEGWGRQTDVPNKEKHIEKMEMETEDHDKQKESFR